VQCFFPPPRPCRHVHFSRQRSPQGSRSAFLNHRERLDPGLRAAEDRRVDCRACPPYLFPASYLMCGHGDIHPRRRAAEHVARLACTSSAWPHEFFASSARPSRGSARPASLTGRAGCAALQADRDLRSACRRASFWISWLRQAAAELHAVDPCTARLLPAELGGPERAPGDVRSPRVVQMAAERAGRGASDQALGRSSPRGTNTSSITSRR